MHVISKLIVTSPRFFLLQKSNSNIRRQWTKGEKKYFHFLFWQVQGKDLKAGHHSRLIYKTSRQRWNIISCSHLKRLFQLWSLFQSTRSTRPEASVRSPIFRGDGQKGRKEKACIAYKYKSIQVQMFSEHFSTSIQILLGTRGRCSRPNIRWQQTKGERGRTPWAGFTHQIISQPLLAAF